MNKNITEGEWSYEKTAFCTLSDGTEVGQVYTISNTKDFKRKSIARIEAKGREDDILNDFRYSNEEAEANVKLMAASKDLLKFAIEMAERYSNSEWIVKEANAVIKKSTI